jgi:hypothetical protein
MESNLQIGMPIMDNQILTSLKNPPDYTEKFTEKIKKIRDSISAPIGWALYHDKDMNYSAAQRLCLFLDENYSISNKHSIRTKYEIVFLMSSKANFFTYVCLQKKEPDCNGNHVSYWELMSEEQIQPDISQYIRVVCDKIIKHGYELICGDVLQKKIEGSFTELDGAPATLFEILFTELY